METNKEGKLKFESLKEEGLLLRKFLTMNGYKGHLGKKDKGDPIDMALEYMRKLCREKNVVEEFIHEDQDDFETTFWTYNKEQTLEKLQKQRNELNRQIATIKRATLKN